MPLKSAREEPGIFSDVLIVTSDIQFTKEQTARYSILETNRTRDVYMTQRLHPPEIMNSSFRFLCCLN